MNHEVETEIIKNYVVKNKQDRIIWELGSLQKRDEVMWRFHHNLDIFKKECLYPVEYMNPEEMEECMAAPPRYMLIANERLRKNGIKI